MTSVKAWLRSTLSFQPGDYTMDEPDRRGTGSAGMEPLVGQLTSLVAPLRFGIVAHPIEARPSKAVSQQSIYKGSFPRRRNLPFLSRLRLKTVLSLTPKPLEALDADVCSWAKKTDVALVHIKCEKPKEDGGGLSREGAAKALLHLLDSRQLPIYVHCLDGQSVSTLLIAILRKVQAWSMRAIVDEISRNLGYDEEVIQYQTSFVEKYGKPEWVRLPPRRFLPDWIWNDPSPLKRLKDPYDVLVVREKTADRPTTSSGALANGSGVHPHVHKRQASGDDFSSTSTTNSTAQSSPSAPTYGVGSLPVQHPTLRIRFDLDADLPPPLAPPLISQSLHSRENSSLFSPSSSRPSSRAGRTNPHGHPLHAHQHNSEIRSSSRPGSAHGSPRRRGIPMDQLPPSASPSLDLYLSPPSVQSEFVGSRLAYGSTQSDGEEPAASYVRSIDKATPTVSGRRGSVGSSTPTRPSLLSNSATPRASSSLLKTVRPVSLRGAVHGLGLHGEELEEGRNSEKGEEDNVDADDDDSRRSESPTAHLSAARQQLLSEDGSAHRPMMLERSVSENAVSAPCAKDQTPGSPSEDEYFSDPEEDERRRREGESRGRESSEQARRDDDGGNEAGDEDERDEDDGEGEEEEEEEEEEEDEEEEENDSDGEDDGLALEALDLEGY